MKKDLEKLIKDHPEMAAYISSVITENDALKEKLETVAQSNLSLQNQVEAVSVENTDLQNQVATIKSTNANLQHQVESMTSNNESLQHQIDTLTFTLGKFNRQLFGKKSEKIVPAEAVHNLFNLNEAEEHQNLNASEPDIEKVIKARKPKSTLHNKLKSLESREIIYDLGADEKSCDICHTSLVEVGSKTRETIEVIKKAINVMEKTITYKCPICGSFHKKNSPNLPIPGGIASSSLLAQVIVDKTANALPLYRQSEDYARIGLNLSRQTLSNWMIKSALSLDIIFTHMKHDLLSKDIIHADETTVQVLKESGKATSTKSYMWTYVSGKYDNQVVLYDYQPSRAGINAATFLKGYKGYLHADGFKGYNQVEDVTLVHCMAHLRRKFYDIYVSLPEAEQKNSNTSMALNYCNKIYSLDRASGSLSLEERGLYKKVHIKPLMNEFNAWLNERQLTSSQASSYGKAINYGVDYLPTIMNYLEDPRLELDNNRAERAIKPFVIGRKNWLFSNTPNGAASSALLYSITQTCLLNNLNPYKYIAYLLDVLANQTTKSLDLDKLMPYSKEMIEQFHMNKANE